jgi:hypothetical protein
MQQLQQFQTLSQPSSPCDWGQFINIDYVEEYPHRHIPIKKRTPHTHTHNPYSTYAIDTKVNCKKCTKYLRGTGCICKFKRTIYNFKSHIYQQKQNKNQTKMNELEIKLQEQPIQEQPEETKQDIYVIDIIDNNKDIEYEDEDEDEDEKYIKEKITYMFSMIAFIVLVLVI